MARCGLDLEARLALGDTIDIIGGRSRRHSVRLWFGGDRRPRIAKVRSRPTWAQFVSIVVEVSTSRANCMTWKVSLTGAVSVRTELFDVRME